MPYDEYQQNWKIFSDMIDALPKAKDEQVAILVKRYVEQNILILNDVLTTSIENMQHLQNAKTVNDVICTQARFTHELTTKLTLSAQRFLNASLGHITDYNEWLKAHCDLATD